MVWPFSNKSTDGDEGRSSDTFDGPPEGMTSSRNKSVSTSASRSSETASISTKNYGAWPRFRSAKRLCRSLQRKQAWRKRAQSGVNAPARSLPDRISTTPAFSPAEMITDPLHHMRGRAIVASA